MVAPLGGIARWALHSKALFALFMAVATLVVVAGGTLVGAGIAARNAVEAAPAAAQPAKPGAAAKPNPAQAQQLGPPRAVGVGTVVIAGGDEMLVKPRGNQPPGRVVLMPNGVVWKHGKKVAFAEVQPNDTVFVFGRVDRANRQVLARVVVVDPPRPLRPRARVLDSPPEVSTSRV